MKELSIKQQAEKLGSKYTSKKFTCEKWMKLLKRLKRKKPSLHPRMPTIIIQVNNGRHKN